MRYKDVCKKDMKCFGIHADRWEEMGESRKEWRDAVKEGARKDHAEWIDCSGSAFLPYYLSPRSLPSCLTIQFYSFNQLLFPVIITISSSSIHLLASIPTNPFAPILNR